MFNATAARAVADHDFEKATDRFAAELEDRMSGLSITERETLMSNLLAVVDNADATKAFAGGTYSQAKANDGSAAKALGAGKTVEEESLETLINSPLLDQGQKAALLRVVAKPGDPTRIKVETDGTPSETKRLQTEVTSLTKERDDAKQELADANDKTKTGSLAHQLEAAKSGASTVEKKKVEASVKKIKAALDKSTTAKVGGWGKSAKTVHELEEANFQEATKATEEALDLVK